MSIRAAYRKWPDYNRALRDIVAGLDEERLAMRPSPERWPLWATIGHTLCQRVFWLCVFAGEPGANTTRFTDAGNDCPGDDDLEHVLSATDLVEAIDTTFRIVESCLDTWTLEMLDETLRRPEWDDSWVHTRGSVVQRVFSHDIYHISQVNEVLGGAGLAQIDLWD
ncbi:MAG: DinB family protein [Candidatus Limnocylindrales bacterium]